MSQNYVLVDFKCSKCGNKVAEIIAANSIEVMMQCEFCASNFDLTFGSVNSNIVGGISSHPEIIVSVDDIDYGDEDDNGWMDYPPPEDPHRIFTDACHELLDIIVEYGSSGSGSGVLTHSTSVINRMVFSSAIGAMEAFLGDVLIRAATSENVVLERLLSDEKELKKMKIGLLDVHRKPNIVIDKTREYLSSLLYHNLAKIQRVYLVGLKVDIFPDPVIRARLQKAVMARHDIVHRNGRALSGEIVSIEADAVRRLLEDVKVFAKHVNSVTNDALTLMGFEALP